VKGGTEARAGDDGGYAETWCRMIGAHRHGSNVFSLREDEDVHFFREVDIQEINDNFQT
jgi:hypothetical protein